MKKKKSHGFTLIELIVVLAVLGIIALIAVPRYINVQERTRLESDYRAAASIAHASELHYAKNNLDTGTVDFEELEAAGVLDKNIKLQSKDYKNLPLDNDSVKIFVTPGTGDVVTVVVDGDTLFPAP